MTVERNGPFYRVTLTEDELKAIRATLPSDMQQKITDAEKQWEEDRPKGIHPHQGCAAPLGV